MRYFSFASIAVLSLALAATDGRAQVLSPTATSTSTSSSGSSSNSGAASGSRSQVGNTQTGPQSVTLSQPSSVYSTQPSDVTIRNAPQVYIPSVVTGNVCALGASAGVSVIGVGVGAGYSWESMSCEDRQRIALLHNMGAKNAAKEYACASDKRYYEAMKYEVSPCAVRPAWEPQPAPGQLPVVQQRPVAPPPAPMVQMAPPKEYPKCNPARGINDNCTS